MSANQELAKNDDPLAKLDRNKVQTFSRYVQTRMNEGRLDYQTTAPSIIGVLKTLLEVFPEEDPDHSDPDRIPFAGDLDKTPFTQAIKPKEMQALADVADYINGISDGRKLDPLYLQQFNTLFRQDYATIAAQAARQPDRYTKRRFIGTIVAVAAGAMVYRSLEQSASILFKPVAASAPAVPVEAPKPPTPTSKPEQPPTPDTAKEAKLREERLKTLTSDPSPYSTKGVSLSYFPYEEDHGSYISKVVYGFLPWQSQSSLRSSGGAVYNTNVTHEIPELGLKIVAYEHSSGNLVPKIIILGENGDEGERILKPPLGPQASQVENDPNVVYFRDKSYEQNNRFRKIIMSNPTSLNSAFQIIDMYINTSTIIQINK